MRQRYKRVRQKLTVSVPCQYSGGGLQPHEVTVTTDEAGLVLGVWSSCDHVDVDLDDVGVALAGVDYACCRYLARHVLEALRRGTELAANLNNSYSWRDDYDDDDDDDDDAAPDPQRMLQPQDLVERMPPLLFALMQRAATVAEQQRCVRYNLRARARAASSVELGGLFVDRFQTHLQRTTGLHLRVVRRPSPRGSHLSERLSVIGQHPARKLATYKGRGLWQVVADAPLLLLDHSECTFHNGDKCPVCPGHPSTTLKHLRTAKHAEYILARFIDALDWAGAKLSSDKSRTRG